MRFRFHPAFAWLLLSFVCSAHWGCGKDGGTQSSGMTKSGSAEDPVYHIEDGDAEMNAAIKKARATVDQFIAALRDPARKHCIFSVKKAFSAGGGNEHIWLVDVSFDGTMFHGIVDNDPEHVPNLKIGDRASVSRTELSDWMIADIDHRRISGAYTFRVLRERMSPAERKEFDEHMDATFDD